MRDGRNDDGIDRREIPPGRITVRGVAIFAPNSNPKRSLARRRVRPVLAVIVLRDPALHDVDPRVLERVVRIDGLPSGDGADAVDRHVLETLVRLVADDGEV